MKFLEFTIYFILYFYPFQFLEQRGWKVEASSIITCSTSVACSVVSSFVSRGRSRFIVGLEWRVNRPDITVSQHRSCAAPPSRRFVHWETIYFFALPIIRPLPVPVSAVPGSVVITIIRRSPIGICARSTCGTGSHSESCWLVPRRTRPSTSRRYSCATSLRRILVARMVKKSSNP